MYTSGTTGPPKGCVLSNRNYVAAVDAVLAVEGLVKPGDRALLHLPLAHSFARLVQFLGPSAQLTIAFCPEPAQIPNALREVRPTLLPSVPRLYERLATAIRKGIDDQRGLQGILARRASARRERQRRLTPLLGLELAAADRLVLRRVRERLGGCLRIAISGGAPLAKEPAQFIDALGVRVLEGYGLTECTSIATVNRPGRYRLGTVGMPLEGVELRIAEDAEILIRSETVFAGYYRDEEATREVLTDDGWLRSGDLGRLDADGFLTITDRKKDIIITGGGDNVSPQNIQLALEASPYIAQALVVGDRRPYLVALLTLDSDALGSATPDAEQVLRLVSETVTEVNRRHGRAEQVRRYTVIAHPFSEETGELTPTLKLRRRVCEEHYRDEIEQLYSGGS